MTLEEISYQIYACRKCRLWQDAKHGVPGEGPSEAKVMLIGQNPGATEDELGRPFVGRSGRFLNMVLAENGIKREAVFITSIVKHVSPQNRKPLPDEVAACLPYLIQQISAINPRIVVLMGESAKATPRQDGIEYIETVHPSAAMRFKKMDDKFRGKIGELAKRMAELNLRENVNKKSIDNSKA